MDWPKVKDGKSRLITIVAGAILFAGAPELTRLIPFHEFSPVSYIPMLVMMAGLWMLAVGLMRIFIREKPE